ncbi:hypothetical protein Bca4012_103054 [Brassica carinata]
MLNVYIRGRHLPWPAWKGGSSERYGLTPQCLVQHETRSDGLTVPVTFFRRLFRNFSVDHFAPTSNFRASRGLGLVSSVFQLII